MYMENTTALGNRSPLPIGRYRLLDTDAVWMCNVHIGEVEIHHTGVI